jgi:hypothetical protein
MQPSGGASLEEKFNVQSNSLPLYTAYGADAGWKLCWMLKLMLDGNFRNMTVTSTAFS